MCYMLYKCWLFWYVHLLLQGDEKYKAQFWNFEILTINNCVNDNVPQCVTIFLSIAWSDKISKISMQYTSSLVIETTIVYATKCIFANLYNH